MEKEVKKKDNTSDERSRRFLIFDARHCLQTITSGVYTNPFWTPRPRLRLSPIGSPTPCESRAFKPHRRVFYMTSGCLILLRMMYNEPITDMNVMDTIEHWDNCELVGHRDADRLLPTTHRVQHLSSESWRLS